MKKLLIGGFVKGFDGQPLTVDSTKNSIPVKEILIQYAGTYSSQHSEKMIIAVAAGIKIYNEKTAAVLLTDEEFDVMADAVSKPNHIALIWKSVKDIIDQAEDIKEDKK